MIREPELVRRFEDEQLRKESTDHASGLAVFEALWEEARSLGVLPLADPLEGIEVDIRLAEALNVRRSAGSDRPGA